MQTVDILELVRSVAQGQSLRTKLLHSFAKLVQLEAKGELKTGQASSLELPEIHFAPGHFPVGQIFAATFDHLTGNQEPEHTNLRCHSIQQKERAFFLLMFLMHREFRIVHQIMIAHQAHMKLLLLLVVFDAAALGCLLWVDFLIFVQIMLKGNSLFIVLFVRKFHGFSVSLSRNISVFIPDSSPSGTGCCPYEAGNSRPRIHPYSPVLWKAPDRSYSGPAHRPSSLPWWKAA